MSIHIDAQSDQIAEIVLLPGDPLRAKHIADNFLTGVIQYNSVRGMLGFTGMTADNKRVSVQGSGMGMPTLSIYVHELIEHYGVKRIVRLGSCGSLQEDIKCRDIIIAMGACSDSALNKKRFGSMNFSPIASWPLLLKAYETAKKLAIDVKIGNIFCTDEFYDDAEAWKIFTKYQVLGIEMETAALYTLGAEFGIQTLTINTVSDNLVTKEFLSATDRQETFSDMVNIALNL